MMLSRATRSLGRRFFSTTEISFSCLDIRVGKIIQAEIVDESDKLFKSRIDVGNVFELRRAKTTHTHFPFQSQVRTNQDKLSQDFDNITKWMI